MPYQLSDDERLIRDTVRQFAQERIGLEAAAGFDRHDQVPEAPLAEAAGLGLTTFGDDGGPGATAFALAIDELAQVCPNTAAILAAHTAARRILGRVPAAAAASGRAAFLVTEEAHGSEASKQGTVAKPDGASGFRITGQKSWAIGAHGAQHLAVLANVPGKGPTWFQVPADAPGVTLGANDPIMGLRGAGIRTVYLYGVQVPSAAIAGEVGQGLALLRDAQAWLQLGAAAALCGCVAGGAARAREFAQQRVQFNQPIATYQAVSDGITEMDVQLEAARALCLAAAAHVAEPDGPVWSARAKAFATSMAIPMTRQAIRVMGGTGFMREGGSERFARDARALQFVGQTVHMQRETLKRHLLPDVEWPPAP